MKFQSVFVRSVVAVLAFMVLGTGVLLAQGAADVSVVTAPQLTSVGAVLVAAIFCTAVAKKLLMDVPVASRVPIFVYVCLFAVGLTYLANRVLGTLPGDFWLLAWSAVYNGAAASGVREWVYNGMKPMADSGTGSG